MVKTTPMSLGIGGVAGAPNRRRLKGGAPPDPSDRPRGWRTLARDVLGGAARRTMKGVECAEPRLDNFEWVFGFKRRFGLGYVDFDSQERIWKGSAYDYQSYIRENGFAR